MGKKRQINIYAALGVPAPATATTATTAADPSWDDASAQLKRQRTRNHTKEDRGRKIQSSWFLERSWLRVSYLTEKCILFCNACSVAAGELVTFKIKGDRLSKHEATTRHKDAIGKCQGGEYSSEAAEATRQFLGDKNGNGRLLPTNDLMNTFDKGLPVAMQKEFEKKLVQFMLIYGTMKKNRPMTDYEYDHRLLKAHPSINDIMPRQHATDFSGWEMADAMNSVLVKEMQCLLARADFFSLTVDASTAIDNTDYLNIEARLWYGGRLHFLFVAMRPLGTDCTAASQEELLMETMTSDEFGGICRDCMKHKLVAMAADGCSTMQGQQNGLLARMRRVCPYMQKMSCVAHKLNIIVEKLPDGFTVINDVYHAVQRVSVYFNTSPKRCAQLKQEQEFLGLDILKPVTLVDTRWLPLYDGICTLRRIYPAVLRVLVKNRRKDPGVAEVLYQKLTSVPVLVGMYALQPFYQCLHILTKELQKSFLYPGDVAAAVSHCLSKIKGTYNEVKFEDQESLKKLLNDVYQVLKCTKTTRLRKGMTGQLFYFMGKEDVAEDPNDMVAIKDRNQPTTIPRLEECVKSILSETKQAANLMVFNLESGMPREPLLKALCIVTPRYWMQLKRDFGNIPKFQRMGKVNQLVQEIIVEFCEPRASGDDMVPPLLDTELLEEQFDSFFRFMEKRVEDLEKRMMNTASVEDRLNIDAIILNAGGEEVATFWSEPNIPSDVSEYARLAHLALCIPYTSVDNERRFSVMNLVSTQLRNRLQVKHLNTCIRIAATTYKPDDVGFFKNAFQEWKKLKERRNVMA